MNIMEKLTDVLGTWADWMNSNKYLTVIKNSFAIYLPFTMIGSFASLFAALICSTTTGLASIAPLAFLAGLKPAFSTVEYITLSCMSIPVAFLVGREMGKLNNVKPNISGIVALCGYLSCVPLTTSVTVDETVQEVTNVLPASSTNAQGLFVAFIVGILSCELFSALMHSKLKIKLPDSVPGLIADSFNALIPSTLTVFIVSLLSLAFRTVTGMYLMDAIYKLIQAPLGSLAQQSWIAVILIVFLPNLLWILGIHGAMVMNPLMQPLYVAALAANIEAVSAGQQATNILTPGFLGGFLGMGGNGITIALIVAILLFSKRADQKEVAKLGLIPSIFGISEPVMFGLPIVLNPVYMIPFILAPTVSFFIAYFSIAWGFVPCSTVSAPWGLPLIARAFVSFPSAATIVVCVLILVVSFLIYLPFVLIDNRLYAKEQAAKNDEQ